MVRPGCARDRDVLFAVEKMRIDEKRRANFGGRGRWRENAVKMGLIFARAPILPNRHPGPAFIPKTLSLGTARAR